MRSLILVYISLLTLTFSGTASALFDDTEARKKILELQQQLQNQSQSAQQNQQALEQRIASLEAVIKGQGLTDMLSQVDRLNQELSRVKGQLEVANHNIDNLQQRQKDLYSDTDERLRKLESVNAPASGANPQDPAANDYNGAASATNSAEDHDFDAAQELLRNNKYREAFDAYDKFLQLYPVSRHAAEAQYGLGFAQFSLKNYKASITTQQKLLRQYPDSPKAADALFNIANNQIQLSDLDSAKKTLRELLSRYPASEVAPNAKRRLAVLESIKTK